MKHHLLLAAYLAAALGGWLGFRGLVLQWPAIPAKVSIFIITVDSLRPENLSAYGYERATSANLERLARDGVRFDRAINQASWTNAAMASIWTSRYPSVHGVEGRDGKFPAGALTPLHLLRAAGYAAPGVSYLTQTTNYDNLGFEPARERDPLAWLDAHAERPFFLWVHLTQPHLPYAPGASSLARFDPQGRLLAAANAEVINTVRRHVIIKRGTLQIGAAERRAITALYDGEVFDADAKIGSFLDGLAARGLEASTLVIVSADHGEELGDHGHVGHASTSLAGTTYQELIHVPLIMRLPGVLPRGMRIPQVVEGIDLMPTIFDLLRLPRLSWSPGRSLLPLIFDARPAWKNQAFAETTVCGFQCRKDDGLRLRTLQTPRWKYIQRVRNEAIETEELYNLQDDPGEMLNLAQREPIMRRRLRARLQEVHAANRARRLSLVPPPTGPPSTPATAATAKTGDAVEVVTPKPGEVLRFASTGGAIVLRVKGSPSSRFRIQYDIGRGDYRVQGELRLRGAERVYGPYSHALWSRFALYNPWRFRIAREGSSTWSEWITFSIGS